MKVKNSNKSLLVLPSWYPSKLDKTSGDFIQRHIEAIALYKHQYVIYVVKDDKGIITKSEKVVLTEKENYTEEVIYYHPLKTNFRIINKIFSQRHYNAVYKNALKKYLNNYGQPQLVHVHVAQKAGLMAVWLKKKFKIPFIVSEHWTAYLPEADLKMSDYSILFQLQTKKILQAARLITVVSNHLGKAMKINYPFINYKVIPNVVNEKIIRTINPKSDPEERKIFVHASTQNFQKNTEAILESFALLKKNKEILLQLFGPTGKSILNKIKELQIENLVEIKGNVKQKKLFYYIKNATAVILYSRFETFGCVLIEANALGVPVIVSDLPVFKEFIVEGINGVYAGNNNPEQLAAEILKLVTKETVFKEDIVKEAAANFEYNKVGKLFIETIENE